MSTKKTASTSNPDNPRQATRARAREASPVHPPVGGVKLGPIPKTDPHKAAVIDECYRLALTGMPATKIAKRLGIHRETVGLYLKEEGDRRLKELAQERTSRIERTHAQLTRIAAVYEKRFIAGNYKGDEGKHAAEIAEKAAKLMGDHAPERVQVEDVTVNPYQALEPQQLFEMMRKLPDNGTFAQKRNA